MDFRRGRRDEDLEINLVPLIDVLLVIIIFLVVNATFSRMSELQINLPAADANPVEQKPLMINVGIDATGHMVVQKTPVNKTDLSGIIAALQQAVAGGKDPVIVISADAKTTHQSVINVMEAARQAGYTHITFATQQDVE
ncbi:MAG: biopolymer transporter ExbD [Candidatus Methylopumilus sp.]|jgi:biopolymer transport protein ExbD|nr:biopolymer transporter ExbD [Candidatus Methylopumilus sp.]NBW61525.1 biopolymer transporter ExbD [Methylophilaceae bacterium]